MTRPRDLELPVVIRERFNRAALARQQAAAELGAELVRRNLAEASWLDQAKPDLTTREVTGMVIERRHWSWLRQAVGLALAGVVLAPPVAWAGQNVLTWQDNSTNEANFHIDRTTAADVTACQSAGGWMPLATTGANITTFTDTMVVEGATYCYRVQASNAAGSSGYSNVAGRSVPFTIPVAPSGLTVGP